MKMIEKPSFDEIMKVFNFLSSENEYLEEQLEEFNKVEREQIYSHNLIEEFDLLP